MLKPTFIEIKELRDASCVDPWYQAQGNKMMQWIMDTLDRWDKDEKIVWRVAV